MNGLRLALVISAAVCGLLAIVIPEKTGRLAGAGVILLAAAALIGTTS